MVALILLLTLYQPDSISFDSLIPCLVPAKGITMELVDGEFNYYYSDHDRGIYKAVFVGGGSIELKYMCYGPAISDSILVDGLAIPTPKKIDPLTTQVYKLKFRSIDYLCLLSKSSSASGTGNQITFYSLTELKGNKVGKTIFLNSRFGIAQNFGDMNGDGQLDFLKITKTGESTKSQKDIFLVQACDLNSKVMSNNFVTLEYNGNNNVKFIEAKWFFKTDCN